jgi:hypothetical protein
MILLISKCLGSCGKISSLINNWKVGFQKTGLVWAFRGRTLLLTSEELDTSDFSTYTGSLKPN